MQSSNFPSPNSSYINTGNIETSKAQPDNKEGILKLQEFLIMQKQLQPNEQVADEPQKPVQKSLGDLRKRVKPKSDTKNESSNFTPVEDFIHPRCFITEKAYKKKVISHKANVTPTDDKTNVTQTNDNAYVPLTNEKTNLPPTTYVKINDTGSAIILQIKNRKEIVIKRTSRNSNKDGFHEFKIGLELNKCKHFVKSHQLLVKKYYNVDKDGNLLEPKTHNSSRYDLMLERVVGQNLKTIMQDGKRTFTLKVTTKLLLQAKESCLYLFDRGIAWGDLNDGNILITNGKNLGFLNIGNNLKICDYEDYQKIEDSNKRTLQLMLGAMEILGYIVRATYIDKTNKNLVDIIYPNEIFGDDKPEYLISSERGGFRVGMTLSAEGKIEVQNPLWYQTLQKAIENCEDKKQFLDSYFDQVIKALKN